MISKYFSKLITIEITSVTFFGYLFDFVSYIVFYWNK